VILPRHEQAASFAAEGFCPCDGQGWKCHGHVRPRRDQSRVGIADAYMDSIRSSRSRGQVFSKYIWKMAFQETDFFGMTLPVVSIPPR